MEVQIRDKGRLTLPRKMRKALGINEKDWLIVETEGNKIVIKPKNTVTVAETRGIIKSKKRVKLEDIEQADGRLALS
jgi:AbrB family looped-hinge helix DNA binding protein